MTQNQTQDDEEKRGTDVPANFTGSRAHMRQCVANAGETSRALGHPTLFITVTPLQAFGELHTP